MRIKITRHGCLELERAAKMKEMICPYATNSREGTVYCGDWCPKFNSWTEDKDRPFPVAEIDCCGTRWACEAKDFTDEREVGG